MGKASLKRKFSGKHDILLNAIQCEIRKGTASKNRSSVTLEPKTKRQHIFIRSCIDLSILFIYFDLFVLFIYLGYLFIYFLLFVYSFLFNFFLLFLFFLNFFFIFYYLFYFILFIYLFIYLFFFFGGGGVTAFFDLHH